MQGEIDGSTDDPGDWLAMAEKQNRRKALLRDREIFEQRLAKARRDEARSKHQQDGGRPAKRVRLAKEDHTVTEDEFMLDDYNSEDDKQHIKSEAANLSASTRSLLEKLQGKPIEPEVEEPVEETKVIFCSRTHSQLTQFVNELRRVKMPSSAPAEDDETEERQELVRHLPLGSRKNLCINDKVARLQSTNAINERCLELQKPGTAKQKKCPHYPNKETREIASTFQDRAISKIRDIEDIAQLGREMKICPYYASRGAIAPSEVLTLPYPLMLQRSAREALGVSVKDNIIVIDEAHNLMDAIADTFSVTMQLTQLKVVTQQVIGYVERFKTRLKGKNRVYITQLIRLLNSIADCVDRQRGSVQQQDLQVTAAQLMAGKGVDQIKPHKLLQYIHQSKLAYKVEGYTIQQVKGIETAASRGQLMLFQSFLTALMNPDAEGRFFVLKQESDLAIRYTLLDPREHFRDIVQDARAVILAGGTMSPMSDYADQLFSYVPAEKLQTFSFGHVIPKENMFVQPVTAGPTGRVLEFSYEKRKNPATILELGLLIERIVASVPDGVVAFFPSYDYLAQVTRAWQGRVMDSLKQRKTIFEESKGVSVDILLRDYAQAIETGKGALLLSVVGGKLSEGINFADKLGRAVICIGLPFPNASGGEWKAKIEHIEHKKFEQCRSSGVSDAEGRSQGKAAGRDIYENACMRAVNQSIGRAIRHRGDYAAIMLVDRRFATERIRRKLPGWIQDTLPVLRDSYDWRASERGLVSFFASK